MIGRNNSDLATLAVAKCLVGTFLVKILEAIAILYTVEEIVFRCFHHVELESDCQRVINILSSSVSTFSEMGKLAREIKEKYFNHIFLFRYVSKAANRMSHNLAHYTIFISYSKN